MGPKSNRGKRRSNAERASEHSAATKRPNSKLNHVGFWFDSGVGFMGFWYGSGGSNGLTAPFPSTDINRETEHRGKLRSLWT